MLDHLFINNSRPPASDQPHHFQVIIRLMGGAHQQSVVDEPSRDALGYDVPQGNRLQQGDDNLRLTSSDPDGLLSGPTSGLQHGDTENHQQQQACWERFLQKKTIKVLVVESDDSTRQVVGALLRHCMYEGSFIPNHLCSY